MNHSIITTLSIVLFFLSLLIYKKTSPTKVSIGLFFVMAFSSLILLIAYAGAYYFTGNGIDEATIYHLKYGLNGAGFFEYRWFIVSIIIALISGAIYLFRSISKSIYNRKSSPINSSISYSLLSISLLLNPASFDIYHLHANSLIHTEYITPQISSDFFDYYRKPQIKPSNDNQKNIVLIYAESLERTYFDETLFPGLIKGLRELESRSTFFTNIKQISGTGWTVAGMTASQCGIPLFTPSHGNSMSGMDQFLSSAVCLGDLLRNKGYQLNYMGGASLDFAGKGKLFKTHGFTDVLGRNELLLELQNKDYITGWGLYDDSLFDISYRRFIESSATGKKFGLFMLTLDTHHPGGHPSKSCEGIKFKKGSNPILNAVACSDYLITKFINKIIHSPYADKTIVVLMSDHLSMRNTAYDLLKKINRRNLFMIIDPSVNNSVEIQRVGSTLDVAPTVLPFLGFTGNIGLGRNLLHDTELEEDINFIHTNLLRWKKPITKFWEFPKIKDSLEIDISAKIVQIDNRRFKLPILIELNSKLESSLKFQFNNSPAHKTLIQHRKTLDDDKYFLLIDECNNTSELDTRLGENGLCLLAGQGKKYSKIIKLIKNITYNVDQLRQLLNLPNDFIAHRVAHAGGGINNKTYTNSIEALESNIKKGFKYFELDFSFTKDGELVCLHDWDKSFNRSFGFETKEKVTLEEFNTLVKNKSEFKKCTVNSLAKWMKENPSAFIVTDVKERNIEALKILKTLPNAKTRVIPQIYYPTNLKAIKSLGFEKTIWTLYRFKGNNDEVLDWVEDYHAPIAITMPKSRAESRLPMALKERKIPSYVHTVNTKQETEKYINKFGVSEIYTDFLPP